MPDIVSLEINPSNGVVKTIGPIGTPAVSEETLKKAALNKDGQTGQETATGGSNVSTGEATGETGTGAVQEVDKAELDKKNLELANKQAELEKDPKFQAIAKREREFRAREAQVKQMLARRENELNARLAQFEAETSEKLEALESFNLLAENAKKNPEPYLRHVFGDNWYDNAVQYKLNGRPVPELVQEQIETKFSAEIKSLREEREREKLEFKREQERQNQAYLLQQDKENQEYINNFFEETKNYIKSKPETFELIHVQGEPAFNLVNQLIEAELVQNGKFLSMQEAADRVEEYLTKQAMAYSKTKKFAPKVAVEPAKTETQPIEQRLEVVSQPNKGAKTLTNQMTVSTPSTFSQSKTEQDRMRRAMAVLEGKKL